MAPRGERTDDRAEAAPDAPVRSSMVLIGSAALIALILGGLNWGLVGLAGFDLVAEIFGPMSPVARAVYVVIGVAALYCAVRLPRWSRAG